MKIKIEDVKPNPQQPRKEFNQDELQQLANSIEQVGLINPIAVEEDPDGKFTLIDGERRLRAARMAGLLWIDAHVKQGRNGNSENMRLAEATAANMQRSDMNLIEQAEAISKMIEAGYTMNEVQNITGLTQSPINQRLTLLTFSTTIQTLYARGQLPFSARMISTISKIPADRRDDLLSRFAIRNMTEAKIVGTVAFMNQGKNVKHKGRPSIDRSIEIEGALSITKNKHIEDQLKMNVSAACKRCGMNSRDICRHCPITDLVDNWR